MREYVEKASKMISPILLAPGKIYIYLPGLLLLLVLASLLPQILDIFDESYPLLPPSSQTTLKKS